MKTTKIPDRIISIEKIKYVKPVDNYEKSLILMKVSFKCFESAGLWDLFFSNEKPKEDWEETCQYVSEESVIWRHYPDCSRVRPISLENQLEELYKSATLSKVIKGTERIIPHETAH